jgi:hypothetical protein
VIAATSRVGAVTKTLFGAARFPNDNPTGAVS